MRRIGPALLVLLLALVPASAQAPDAAEQLLTPARLETLRSRAIPLIEAKTGVKFTTVPPIRLVSTAELIKILERELAPQMKVNLPTGTPEQLQQLTRRTAAAMGRGMLGKYAVTAKAMLVVPENFTFMAAVMKRPDLISEPNAWVVMVHELVHAHDDQRFAAFAKVGAVTSLEALHALNAVIEGHAQYVTRQILVDRGEQALFERFEALISALPPGMSEAQKVTARAMVANVEFAYIDGRRFFEGLAGLGREGFVAEVFRRPPVTKSVIFKPPTFYGLGAPAPRVIDVKALLPLIQQGRAGWRSQIVPVDQRQLQAGFGQFLPQPEVQAALKGLASAHALILQGPGGGKMLLCAVIQCTDAEAAKRFNGSNLKLVKAKDAAMKQGPVKIDSATYAELELGDGVRGTTYRKAISAGQQTLTVVGGMAHVGRFQIELTFQNQALEDAELKAELMRVVNFLKTK